MRNTLPLSDEHRETVYHRVVTEGRRRVRRRRVATSFVLLALVGAVTGFGVGQLHNSHGDGQVIVGATASPIASACQVGGPPRPGVARTGASAQFGSLPVGYKWRVGVPIGLTRGQTATSGGAQSPKQLSVTVVFGPAQIVSGPNPTSVTIEGHPGQEAVIPDAKSARMSVSWHPESDATIAVIGYGLPSGVVVAAAQTVRYNPGVTAAAVGDLGPVIPRAAAVRVAGALPTVFSHIVTWLVNSPELAAALIAQGQGGQWITQLVHEDQPLWVVAKTSTNVKPSSPVARNAANRNAGQVDVEVINAVTGAFVLHIQHAGTAIPTAFAHLVDHSDDQPCPDPPSTPPARG